MGRIVEPGDPEAVTGGGGGGGVSEHRDEVDGVSMRWLQAGSGSPAVVMVHGIPTSAELWRRVLPAVEGARAVAWEMVGYGGSIPAGRDRDISVARQADYLTAWLDARGVHGAILVGHDLGGGVVQRVALQSPERCAGLVLTNAIAYDSWPVWPMKLVRTFHGAIRHIPDAIMARTFTAVVGRMHRPREIGVQSAQIHWGHYARHGGAAAFVRQARSLDVRDTLSVAGELPGLDVPARVVWGDADPFQSIGWGRRLAADLGAELRPISGGLHFTPEDQPGPVADAINDLVRETTAG